jgi:Domain of unknown function (DUF4124)
MHRLASSWIVSMALLATPALAQVYKWVDEHGMVNYGDKPPLRSKAAHALDEGAGSLSVVPGIPKDELDRLRRQDDRQRLQRLEREVEELRAQAHARVNDVPQTVYVESYVPAYGYPVYGYPGYGHGPQRSHGVRKPGLRPQHPIVEPRPDVRPRRGFGRRP